MNGLPPCEESTRRGVPAQREDEDAGPESGRAVPESLALLGERLLRRYAWLVEAP